MSHTRLLPLIAIVLLLVSTLNAREWTDSTGTHKTEAELVSIRKGKVYLEKSDGAVIAVPLERLSKNDLLYLNSLPEYKSYFQTHPIRVLETPTRPAKERKLTPPKAAEESIAPSIPSGVPESVIEVEEESFVGEVRRFDDLRWGADSLAFSPDGRFLVIGKSDRQFLVFNVATSRQVANHSDLDELGSISCIAFSPDGKKLLTGGSSGRIQIWDFAQNGLVTRAEHFAGHSAKILAITVGADNKTVLSGGNGKKARCWDLTSQRERFVLDEFERSVQATYLTQGGTQGLASDGREVVLIDMKEGKPIQAMLFNDRALQDCAIAPDGSRIVVNNGYHLESVEIKTGDGPDIFEESEIQWQMVFHPNSRYLLSGGSGEVNLWNVQTREKIHEFNCESGTINCIAVSPDQRHFAADVGHSRSVVIFRLPSEVCSRKE